MERSFHVYLTNRCLAVCHILGSGILFPGFVSMNFCVSMFTELRRGILSHYSYLYDYKTKLWKLPFAAMHLWKRQGYYLYSPAISSAWLVITLFSCLIWKRATQRYISKFEKILIVGYFFCKDLEVLLLSWHFLLIKYYFGATYLVNMAGDILFFAF